MISIVICARANDVNEALKENIQNTIGVPYELIVIDNGKNEYSIFSAYNKGVTLSNYDIVCFMHDDISFETMGWGNIVTTQLQKFNVGAIGVAGAPYFATLPGAWWSGGLICKHVSGETEHAYAPIQDHALPVVVVDGLWFCIKKELFSQISFDEDRFTGFHFYDVDISLQIKALGFDILSLYNITISHSSGKLDTVWLQNALIMQKKWEKLLPFSVIDLNYAQKVKIEYRVLAEYMTAMRANGLGALKTIQFAVNQIIKHRIKRFNIVFPFVFIGLALRHFFKKLGLR